MRFFFFLFRLLQLQGQRRQGRTDLHLPSLSAQTRAQPAACCRRCEGHELSTHATQQQQQSASISLGPLLLASFVHPTPAPAGQGKGQVLTMQSLGPGFNIQMQTPCDKCQGKGKIAKHVCPLWYGTNTTCTPRRGT